MTDDADDEPIEPRGTQRSAPILNQTIILAIITLIGTMFSGWIALQQTKLTAKTESIARQVDTVDTRLIDTHRQIVDLEHNTNSIKDALVKTTAEASEAKGKAQEQAAQAGREAAQQRKDEALKRQKPEAPR